MEELTKMIKTTSAQLVAQERDKESDQDGGGVVVKSGRSSASNSIVGAKITATVSSKQTRMGEFGSRRVIGDVFIDDDKSNKNIEDCRDFVLKKISSLTSSGAPQTMFDSIVCIKNLFPNLGKIIKINNYNKTIDFRGFYSDPQTKEELNGGSTRFCFDAPGASIIGEPSSGFLSARDPHTGKRTFQIVSRRSAFLSKLTEDMKTSDNRANMDFSNTELALPSGEEDGIILSATNILWITVKNYNNTSFNIGICQYSSGEWGIYVSEMNYAPCGLKTLPKITSTGYYQRRRKDGYHGDFSDVSYPMQNESAVRQPFVDSRGFILSERKMNDVLSVMAFDRTKISAKIIDRKSRAVLIESENDFYYYQCEGTSLIANAISPDVYIVQASAYNKFSSTELLKVSLYPGLKHNHEFGGTVSRF
jgi:hypothetical protein